MAVLESLTTFVSLFLLMSPMVQIQKVRQSQGQSLVEVNPWNLLAMSSNSALWLCYGLFLPLPPAVLCNVFGLSACCYYLSICWYYAGGEVSHSMSNWGAAARRGTLGTVLFSLSCFLYAASSHEHAQKIGYLAMVVNVLMYGAPLSVIKQVVMERSSRKLPPLQCVLCFFCSLLWLGIGLEHRDVPIILPNLCGLPLAALQLALIWRYPPGTARTGHECDDADFTQSRSPLVEMQKYIIPLSAFKRYGALSIDQLKYVKLHEDECLA
ncbi:unnamed protein product [Durusdinium trenchii]|uniref:Sugar transporter SWEET n=1 Tax=Durusdinium trenchii TaxID=1381693 RepID=A0ABP0QAA2_9DINO